MKLIDIDKVVCKLKELRIQTTGNTNRLQQAWIEGAFAAIQRVIQTLDEEPAIDAAPVVHGRWEEWWPGISLIMTGEEMLYRCSVCDAKYPDVEGYKHCPNCGARMDAKDGANNG